MTFVMQTSKNSLFRVYMFSDHIRTIHNNEIITLPNYLGNLKIENDRGNEIYLEIVNYEIRAIHNDYHCIIGKNIAMNEKMGG